MIARLGIALYWGACILAALAAAAGAYAIWIGWGFFAPHYFITAGLIWAVGRGIRYVLAAT